MNFIVALIVSFTLNSIVSSSITLCSVSLSLDIINLTNNMLMATNMFAANPNIALQLSWIFVLTVVSMLVPFVWTALSTSRLKIKYPKKRYKPILMEEILQDSPLDKLLFSAIVEKKQIMLTLSDRKVYVCSVLSMGEPNEVEGPDQEISITPIMSGYRDKDDLKVKFTTSYDLLDGKELELVIKQDLISSATFFNFDDYSTLNPPEPATKSTIDLKATITIHSPTQSS